MNLNVFELSVRKRPESILDVNSIGDYLICERRSPGETVWISDLARVGKHRTALKLKIRNSNSAGGKAWNAIIHSMLGMAGSKPSRFRSHPRKNFAVQG